MASRQEMRAEETKKSILEAAGKLYSERGYDVVSMREIAKKAKCSHTTIYLYFESKEALLHQLSMPPLIELKKQLESTLHQQDSTSEKRLKKISIEFIRFCLLNRTMYQVFFIAQATRVDTQEPDLEINKVRIDLFNLLKEALQGCLAIPPHDGRLLEYSRIFFFTLHGIIGTYYKSAETFEELNRRLGSTFEDAIEVLLLGFYEKMRSEEE